MCTLSFSFPPPVLFFSSVLPFNLGFDIVLPDYKK